MDKVLLTPNEAWDEREKWSKAMGGCTQDEFIPFDNWRDAAQVRKLLSWLKEPCKEHNYCYRDFDDNGTAIDRDVERFNCPECMAQVEDVLK